MELLLNNIGIIKNSQIKVDGLTVITGKNNSGKTTVGKALYGVVQGSSNVGEAFEQSRTVYVSQQMFRVWEFLTSGRYIFLQPITELAATNEKEEILLALAYQHYDYFIDDKVLLKTRIIIDSLTYEEFVGFFTKIIERDDFYSVNEEAFLANKNKALEICDSVIDTLGKKNIVQEFRDDRIKAFLNKVFNKQIKPVKDRVSPSKITLSENEQSILDMEIINANEIYLSEKSTFQFPWESVILLDDPFILDGVEPKRRVRRNNLDYLLSRERSFPVEAVDYKDYVISLLEQENERGFFDKYEYQKQYSTVLSKINEIVPGEFQRTNAGVFYVNDTAQLDVKNLAGGSKQFFILKQLIINGSIDEKTLLILDEPEAHLHPEWINKYAEILIHLIKEIGVRIVLTTHSPQFLLALNYYAKYHRVTDQSHFYLAKTNDNEWQSEIISIDDNVNEGYAHLSMPMIELSIENDKLTNN